MPSWRPDTAQQRLWLGSNRYRSGRRDARTNAKCLAYSCVKRYPLRGYESDSDSNCNSNGYRYANCDGHNYSYINAQADAYAEVRAEPKASSHTSAETVAVFAEANIVDVGSGSALIRIRTAAHARCRITLYSRLTTAPLASAIAG